MNASCGLPERVDPYKLAVKNGVVEGACSLAPMRRLDDYLLSGEGLPEETGTQGSAQVIMRFFRDNQRCVIIEGEVRARLTLQCQACLQGVDWPIQSEIRLAVVADDDAAAQVPREYEPLIVGDEGIILSELVEDELILAMPTVARCQDENCPRAPSAQSAGERSDNPFAALRGINFDDTTDYTE